MFKKYRGLTRKWWIKNREGVMTLKETIRITDLDSLIL